MNKKIITSFGSAFIDKNDKYYSEIYEIGRILAQKGYIICSGGYWGSMEAISAGAKSVGGKTIGITVKDWNSNTNDYLDEEIQTNNLQERLSLLISKADTYIIFKGGTGTLTEIALTLEMMNKNKMRRKIVYFYRDYWKNTIETLKLDSAKLSSLLDDITIFLESPEDLRTIL